MPTTEQWLDCDVYLTKWLGKLTLFDLNICFININDAIEEAVSDLNLIIDVSGTDNLPFDVPYVLLKSGVLSRPSIGKIAIVGSESADRVVFDIIQQVTHHEFAFVPSTDHALAYLGPA